MQEVDRKKDFRSIMSASRTGRRKKQPYAVLSVGEYARQGLARPTSPPMTQHSHAESACIALHEHDRQWSGNHRVVEGWGEGGFARVRSAGRRDNTGAERIEGFGFFGQCQWRAGAERRIKHCPIVRLVIFRGENDKDYCLEAGHCRHSSKDMDGRIVT